MTDRASESARGERPRSDPPHTQSESARNRWPIGGSFSLGGSSATRRGGASKSPLQAFRAAVYQAPGPSSESGGAGTTISCTAPQSSATADVAGVAEPSSVRRSSTYTALPAASSVASSQVSGSRQESPKSPLLFVAGRSPSEASSSSSEYTPRETSSVTETVGKNTKPETDFKGRIKAGDCAVKVLGGANPAAVELYFKRKAQERARAAAPAPRPAAALAVVSGS
ncbi:unnamed protein product [Closterium sp. Yama58-4]|nr:unnamed protein product [Closterium sp. Yama58-4]